MLEHQYVLFNTKLYVVVTLILWGSYSGEVLGSKLGPGDWLSCFRFFVVFLSPSRLIPG
jgi:hypothetical protein